jgi:FdhD protein
MGKEKFTKSFQALQCGKGACRTGRLDLIGEEPLSIRIDDKPYVVVMRTPGEEIFHAAGFCLGEGIADSPGDFVTIGYCREMDPNVIDVRLTPERRAKIPEVLERRSFVSQTSCGICGKELVKSIEQAVTPMEGDFEFSVDRVAGCVDMLVRNQKRYKTTRSSHAALLLDAKLKAVSFAEDVGRHNALDKAIGKAFMNGTLSDARIAVLSSRISYELVQKAARARVPVIIGVSRPTALAVEMCQALNMTLAFCAGGSEVVVVCGKDRIVCPSRIRHSSTAGMKKSKRRSKSVPPGARWRSAGPAATPGPSPLP